MLHKMYKYINEKNMYKLWHSYDYSSLYRERNFSYLCKIKTEMIYEYI